MAFSCDHNPQLQRNAMFRIFYETTKVLKTSCDAVGSILGSGPSDMENLNGRQWVRLDEVHDPPWAGRTKAGPTGLNYSDGRSCGSGSHGTRKALPQAVESQAVRYVRYIPSKAMMVYFGTRHVPPFTWYMLCDSASEASGWHRDRDCGIRVTSHAGHPRRP
jgi:hypothetical protein